METSRWSKAEETSGAPIATMQEGDVGDDDNDSSDSWKKLE